MNATPPSANVDRAAEARAARRRLAAAACAAAGRVAMVFATAVALTLAASEIQVRRAPPLDLRWAAPLVAEAREGEAAAAASLRQLDALARHAFFGHAIFRRTGLLLLFGGLAVALILLQAASALAQAPPDPRRYGAPPRPDAVRGVQRTVLAAALGIGMAGTVALWLWPTKPTLLPEAPSTAPPPTAPPPTAPDAPDAPARVAATPTLSPWPSFRGPRGDGVAAASPPDLAALATGATRWRTPLDRPGFSSPVVGGNLVFLTTGDAATRDVRAFDLETGVPRWTTVVPFGAPAGTPLPKVTDDTGFAASTPAADSDNVYAIFATGDLVALRHDGTLRWQRHLGIPENPYGHASSLLTWQGVVYVQFDAGQGGRVLAVRGDDGTVLWDLAREVKTSWASPTLLTADEGGAPLLLLNAPDDVAAHRLSDGRLEWREHALTGEVAPSPALADGRLFLAQAYSRLVVFDLRGGTPAQLWQAYDDLPDIASPVAGHGSVWIATSHGAVSCHAVEDGALRWRHDFDEGFNASPILAGGHLFLLDLKGNLRILATGATHEELATVALGAATYATPAFLEGRLIVRTASALLALP